MESNRDEADRCIDIALSAFATGNYEKSERFLRKAENLYPTQRAKEILAKIRHFSNENNSRKRGANQQQQQQPPNNPRTNGSGDESPTADSTQRDYTKEQMNVVRRIKTCKDFYEVLGVTKESSDSDIKKAYKKLALQLHPDKNKAPGASEAFKAVGNAVATLTDPEKRKAYDLYGINDNLTTSRSSYHRNHSHHHNHGHNSYEYGFSRGFESDITAEELFNMFFGGGYPQTNAANRPRAPGGYYRNESNVQHFYKLTIIN